MNQIWFVKRFCSDLDSRCIMKATSNIVKEKAKKEIYYASEEELRRVKQEQMRETFSKLDPEQVRKFLNREI